MHVQDLHATVLCLMGLDALGLVSTFMSRPERPKLHEGEQNHRRLASVAGGV